MKSSGDVKETDASGNFAGESSIECTGLRMYTCQKGEPCPRSNFHNE
jgi:hypothetical protein